MLTSRYPHHCVPGHEYRMPEDQKTVAHAFNENGYETDCLTDLLLSYIQDRKDVAGTADDKPFFAVLSVQPPHNPYVAPPEFMAKHNPQQLTMRPNVPAVPRVQERARRQLAGAYAQIENLDWNVGRVCAALATAGLDKDTHLVFFSDHGDMHGSHGQFLKMSPYEESIRVPFIIGGCTPMGYDGFRCGGSPALVNHVDIAPTTLGLCGIEKPDWMEGFDYSGVRVHSRTLKEMPDSAYIQTVIPTGHGDSVDQPFRVIVTNDGWKYVCFEHQQWLMFNLNEDPYEQVNLAFNVAYSARRKVLNERLAKWIADTDDAFVLPSYS